MIGLKQNTAVIISVSIYGVSSASVFVAVVQSNGFYGSLAGTSVIQSAGTGGTVVRVNLAAADVALLGPVSVHVFDNATGLVGSYYGVVVP